MEIKFSDARNFLIEVTGKNRSSVNNITEEAKTSLSNITEKAQERLGEVTIQAIDNVSQTTKQAQTSLIEATHRAINNVQQVSGKAINSVNETAEQANLSLETKLDKLETVSNATTEAIQKAFTKCTVVIASSIHTWLNLHPIIHSLVNHPFLTLGIILVSIFLILSLFQAIITLVQQAGLSLLKSPFIFGQFIISKTTNSFGKTATQQQIIPLSSSDIQDTTDTLETLMKRLEEITQEQKLILQEISRLINLNK